MTLLDLIMRAAGAAPDLKAFLERVRDVAPDLAPAANQWIAALDAAVSAESIAAVVTALPAELAAIARGKLDPRDHPSDAV